MDSIKIPVRKTIAVDDVLEFLSTAIKRRTASPFELSAAGANKEGNLFELKSEDPMVFYWAGDACRLLLIGRRPV